MCVTESNTCRHAWWQRRQVSSESPAKGDSEPRIAAKQPNGKHKGQNAYLRSTCISAEVPWGEPREKRPSGLANADQNCPPGVGCRDRLRLTGQRSRRGVEQPGPGAKRDGAYPINDLSRRQTSPVAVRRPARSFQRLAVAFGEPERLIHDTDGRQTCHEAILR